MGDLSLRSGIGRSGTPLRITIVKGGSMEPTLRAGQLVAVDTGDRVPSPPGLFVIWDGLGLVIKRVEPVAGSSPPRVRLSADNPRYSAWELPLDDVDIEGRVVGCWQPM